MGRSHIGDTAKTGSEITAGPFADVREIDDSAISQMTGGHLPRDENDS
jgi:hypothetical protein